jgi:aryl-alcohol dehydrogenase-like predicted oxidoreductase
MAQGNDIILIPGNKTRRHLEENVKAIEVSLTQEDLALLDKICQPALLRHREPGTCIG